MLVGVLGVPHGVLGVLVDVFGVARLFFNDSQCWMHRLLSNATFVVGGDICCRRLQKCIVGGYVRRYFCCRTLHFLSEASSVNSDADPYFWAMGELSDCIFERRPRYS